MGLHAPDMTTADRIELAARWAAVRYAERTVAVAENTAPVHDVSPAYRVTWSEVREQFDLTVAQRAAFQPAFEAELRKRGLLSVLRGRRTAREWLQVRRSDQRCAGSQWYGRRGVI